MSVKKWTENQKSAISATGGAVLVSAAAGSGKTAVLVQRVIERITSDSSPVDVDRLLIVTYTKAAAAEMKERIYARLEELINEDPYNTRLLRQQLLLPNAQISTIHSFCGDIIRNNFFALNISSDFRLADETELELIKNLAISNVLEALYKENSDEFLKLTDAYSTTKNDRNIENIIFTLYNFLCSHAFPDKWLDEKLDMYSLDIPVEESVWGKIIINYTLESMEYFKSIIETSYNIFYSSPELKSRYGDKLPAFLDYYADYIDKMLLLIKNPVWDKICEHVVSSFSPPTFPRGKKGEDTNEKIMIQHNVQKIKDFIVKVLSGLYYADAESGKSDIIYLSSMFRQIVKTVKMFRNEFSKLKSEKGIADFNDLEHFALKLLVDENETGYTFSSLAYEMSEKFDEVMVDEYQDANEVQELIFNAVSDNGKKLFVVGDVKQSIYGFRQANPQIFINRKDKYSLYNPNDEHYPAKIILDKNFRSREGITSAVNFVFERLMSKKLGQMDYTSEDMLYCGADYPKSETPDICFHILDSTLWDGDNSVLEARHIAKIIKQMAGSYSVTENSSERPAKYSDFAILLRSAKNTAPIFVSELSAAGIPCKSDGTKKFLTSWEISIIFSLLKIIDNPLQDIAMLNVMLSPMFSFTEDELAEIRINSPGSNLYTAVKRFADSGHKKSDDFLASLDEFRILAAATPTDLLINYIYSETLFTCCVSSMENGDSMLNNLRLFQEYAKNYESSGYKGLSMFVNYITRVQENDGDLSSSSASSDSGDFVSVMSIHHSKGLEYPICFIANTNKKFNNDLSDTVLLHRELGIGMYINREGSPCKYTTMPREAIAIENDNNAKSEELRVLYVAMTRAKEKLFITGSVNKPSEAIFKAFTDITDINKLSPFIVSSAKSMFDWILRCALMHPSGNALREYLNLPLHIVNDNLLKPWEIKIIDSKQYEEKEPENKHTGNEIESVLPQADIMEIMRRIEAVYPYSELSSSLAKVSASQLIHGEQYIEYAFKSKPKFLNKGAVKGAEKGTALHLFLQYANLNNAKLDMEKEIQRLVEYSFLTERQATAIDTESLKLCINSDIMKRILASENIKREYRFFVPFSLNGIEKEFSELKLSKDTIIQGAVDCVFEEDDGMVIVDYKSDRVKELSNLQDKYSLQLMLYKNALEQVFNKPIKECIIYSLYLNSYISI